MEDELLTPPPPTFFRFPDETVGMDALRSAGFIAIDEEGNESIITASHHHALSVIGTIQRGGEWDEEGNELVAPTTLDGWHVNYVGELPDGWEAFEVTPSNPYRVFA